MDDSVHAQFVAVNEIMKLMQKRMDTQKTLSDLLEGRLDHVVERIESLEHGSVNPGARGGRL